MSAYQLSLRATFDPAVLLNAPDTLSHIQYDKMSGDTSFALFVEAPVGQPPAEYVMRTTMRRGMFGETAPIPDAVTRYFLFSDPVAAKAHEFTSPGPIASQNITMYPHPAHGLVHFSFEKNDAVAATVYDLVGRRVIEADVRSIGSGSVGTINTTGLRTGSYILVIRTPDKVYTRMMEVLQ